MQNQITEGIYSESKGTVGKNIECNQCGGTKCFSNDVKGCSGRLQFSDWLENAMLDTQLSCRPVAVMCLGLSGLDSLDCEPEVKEAIAQEAGKRIKSVMRRSDKISRVSASEYYVLAKDFSHVSFIDKVSGRVLKALSQPFKIGEKEYSISSSAGCAFYPFDGEDKDRLISNAKKAMYASERNSASTLGFFSADRREEMLERLRITNLLCSAIGNRELEIYYQPQIDAQTGAVTGLEALTRWNHPEFGLIMPSDFIPVAEKSGLIMMIGKWVAEEACRQNKLWQDMGFDICPISINLSGRQFEEPGLAIVINDILKESGLAANFLRVEVTESVSLLKVPEADKALRDFKEFGIGISLDDFGIGCSSFRYLKVIPACAIKIDKSFVRGIGSSREDEAIIRCILSLARDLRIEAIAEGVETKEQFDFLRIAGCNTIQGYYFHKPLPASEIEKLLIKKTQN